VRRKWKWFIYDLIEFSRDEDRKVNSREKKKRKDGV
jgi:hypothetical protein